MKSFFIILISFFTFSASFSQSINGKVIDSVTQKPVEGVTITLVDLGSSTITDISGNFQFNGEFPKNVRASIEKEGYISHFTTFTFPLDVTWNIELKESHVELDEVVIVASRGTLQRETVTHIETKKIEELNTVKSTNLGEALSKIPGVYAASTGNGISKPVIRGLSGTRVVTLLNGIRIENQQWGSDHGMGVTALGVGSVEILKGPASLYYGSDALGGIVYFVDEAYAKSGYVEEKFGSSFEFNGLNSQSYTGIKFSENKFRMNVFAGYNSAADFRLPNMNYLVNSRYEDKLAKISMGYSQGKWVTNLRYTYLSSHVGIPGESEDSIVTPLSFQSDVTSRKLNTPFQYIENHIASWENRFFFGSGKELQINIGNTFNSLNEFEESADEAALAMRLNSTVYTVKYKHYLGSRVFATIGIQGMDQRNRNNENAEERLIPNANSLDNGAFLVIDGAIREFKLQAGIRGDLRSISVKDDSIHFSKDYSSLNYSVGALRIVRKSTFRLNFSSGFRAPHTSELLANGAHEGALRYEIGSTDLKTEQATQIDFSYEYGNEHVSLVFNPFFNRINNYIYLSPIDSIIEDRPVYVYSQADQVALYGADFGVHLHPHFAHGFHLESTYSYVRGEQHSGTSLPFIPQSRINTLIKVPFTVGSKSIDSKNAAGYLAIQHSYYFAQNRISEFETNTKAYSLFDVSFSLKLDPKESITLGGGVKNIFNTAYFNHLSSLKNIGIQQQGRNFYVSVAVSLEQKMKD